MSKIEIPAKVLRAAALFASKDEARRILCGVRIAWTEGDWDVAATDSYRVFNAWSDHQIGEPEGELVVDPLVFSGLKASDGLVCVDTEMLTITARQQKGGDVVRPLSSVEGNFPAVQRVLDANAAVAPGHPAAVNAEFLAVFCNAAKILAPKNKRTVRFGHQVKDERPIDLRLMIVDWPGLRDEPFCALGGLMPVRL